MDKYLNLIPCDVARTGPETAHGQDPPWNPVDLESNACLQELLQQMVSVTRNKPA